MGTNTGMWVLPDRVSGWLLPRLIVLLAVVLVGAVVFGAGQYWVPRWWAEATRDTTHGEGVVYSVADGDTFTVVVGDSKVRIRILGIDAPEVAHGTTPAGCGGPEAKQAVVEMMPKGADVSWVTDPVADQQDVYGRVLAYVSTAQVDDVGKALIVQGRVAAWIPTGEPYPTRWSEYTKAEKTARKATVGSWALCDTLGR